MNKRAMIAVAVVCAASVMGVASFAHEPGELEAPILLAQATVPGATAAAQNPPAASAPTPIALASFPESNGPVAVRSLATSATSGSAYWRFVAAKDVLPIPDEIKDKLTPAHGTLIVDRDRDIVYWGLQNVGWVKFTNHLTKSEIVKPDHMAEPQFNIHGAELLPRPGQLPLVVYTDNVGHRVLLSDTDFKNTQVLTAPPEGSPYTAPTQFSPTDATFTKPTEVFVTDGYGQAFFMPLTINPLQYVGKYLGGKQSLSQTPHGITYDPADKGVFIAARPEGLIKKYYPESGTWGETLALPAGSTVCDVELWGDYALAPCLDGGPALPRQATTNPTGRGTRAPASPRPAGPIYVLNMKNKSIASTVRPKDDLGFDQALHIHDATWYFMGEGDQQELYILFTYWNPGGIGAMKLVKTPS